VERVWDVHPYPRKTEINIVLMDASSITMATSAAERTNLNYYKDQDVPILWYVTQCTILDQGKLLVNNILPQAYNDGMRSIRIVWIPKSGVVGLQEYNVDVIEVADQIQ